MGPDEYMAKELLQVKSVTAFMTFLTTFWLGKYVMVTWNNLNKGVMQVWGAEDLTEDQIELLNKIVWDFMADYEEEQRKLLTKV